MRERPAVVAGLLLVAAGCAHRQDCPSLAQGDVAAVGQGGSSPVVAGHRYQGAGFATVQCYAGRGDKWAQLELGRRYEAGRGVKRDWKRAAGLYKAAAAYSSGTIWVYSPPVGKHGRGQTIPVRIGMDQAGLAEAKYRLGLMYLEARGVRYSFDRGRELLEEAAKQGHHPAHERLETLRTAPKI